MPSSRLRMGGGATNRSHRDPHKKNYDAHKADRGTDTMHGHGGELFKRDSNLDSKAMSLTERRETAALFYDKKVIAPLWMKVSTTPWTAMAKAAGGYGRQIDDTSVSHDCPSFMHIPQVMSHKPQIGAGGYFSGSTRPAKVVHRDDTTISEDAPDWFQIPSVVAWKQHQKSNPDPGHRKLVLGKEIIFEPKLKNAGKDSTSPIDWSSMTSRQPTARDTARSKMFD